VIANIQDCHAEVCALKAALTGKEPSAIIAASERLAKSIVIIRDTPFEGAALQRSADLIGDILALLETAAVQVNTLRAGACQRIDNLRTLRGSSDGIYSIGYAKSF
jgi:hypothetical protein